MAEVKKALRLVSVARELNVGIHTVIDLLNEKGFEVENKPTVKLTEEMYLVLVKEFQSDAAAKEKAEKISLGKTEHEDIVIDSTKIQPPKKEQETKEILISTAGVSSRATDFKKEEKKEETKFQQLSGPKVLGKVDLEKSKAKEKAEEVKPTEPKAEEVKPTESKIKEATTEQPKAKTKTPAEPEQELIRAQKVKITGPKILGKIDLPKAKVKPVKPVKETPVKVSKTGDTEKSDKPSSKRKRKRIVKPAKFSLRDGNRSTARKFDKTKEEKGADQVSEKQIQDKIKATMAKLGGTAKGSKAKLKRQRKEEKAAAAVEEQTTEGNEIQVTEFLSVSELASMMNIGATDVISKCMQLGIMVSINQRLDAEVIELVADEFEYKVKFISISDQEGEEEIEEEADDPKDLEERAPIVTVMGHVDHGKTSLLDHIRKANVIESEAGGITQHIGAYEVVTESGKRIVFLDTPGHEAFTAMRARGAKVTDIAVIVVAADDAIMPQTKEAISHAQAAAVPMVFAINKIDKDGANPEKIKEQLATMNLLVEDWGGKFQSQDISAKMGTNMDELMEKILLESELLELKANPNKHASGSIIEASLDKGRGYVATILVQDGSLKTGDVVVSGTYYGKVKAMFTENSVQVKEVGPSSAVLVLGFNGAPQAGETFKVYETEQEAKQITNKREQIIREQGLRTKKHITLDEIGRRLALGTFKELNIIVKADVDGSVEALGDALIKLSTEEIVVKVVHSAVGQITESDVLLASASDAIILGFQVRPSVEARKLADKENIEIKYYSIIYDAIDEIKTAMEGMLEPTIEERITGNLEIQELFKITRIGTIGGCVATDGKIYNKSKIRVIRGGIVVHAGEFDSLKRFKDEVKEVVHGQDCGIRIKDFNDIEVGDVVECFEETEIKRTL